ncbi:hypothetical protein [Parvularcula maris]|uniref:SMP-30/Gluconolactonase/LRE-like region domain-containing protein n=1 Tax=Parvularcula maris TaxID=2965077 RepID=A0A9X2L7S7_9PROT|nr:hypothetical protein [Parvularcula maris]MCQ8183787.1 hypothetical protein [Parvularcula maris]
MMFPSLLLTAALLLSEARFPLESCRTVELRDEESGALVAGMEDVTLIADGRGLLVSAYDRLQDQTGGVYRVDKPWPRAERWSARNLTPGSKPHGIAARPGGGFTVIDRSAPGGTALLTVLPDGTKRFEDVGEGEAFPLCAANDLAFDGKGGGFVTIDRGGCGGFWQRLFGGKAASVRQLAPGLPVTADKLSLANGIAPQDGAVWVADMRAKHLVPLGGGEPVELPGAPDNLNASEEGIVAALQPSLWRFGLYRYGHRERAPSLIMLVEPRKGRREVLFEDETGELFPGATAAVLDGSVLFAGSVAGDRLLTCDLSE